MSDTKLSPIYCPCCGSAEIIKSVFPTDYPTEHVRAYVECKECGLQINEDGNVKDSGMLLNKAVEKWNTRRPMERIVEQLEERMLYDGCIKEGLNVCLKNSCNECIYEDAIRIVKKGGMK